MAKNKDLTDALNTNAGLNNLIDKAEATKEAPEVQARKKKATEKTLPVSFRMKEDTVKTLKKIAFYKQLSLKDTLEAIVLEYAKGLNLPKTEDEETKEG